MTYRLFAISWFFGFIVIPLCSAMPATAEDDVEINPDDVQALRELVDHVRKAIAASPDHGDDWKTPEDAKRNLNAISWNRVLGESLATDRSKFSLWMNAVDALSAADAAWKDTQNEENKRLLNQLLEQERVMAMKYDITVAKKKASREALLSMREKEKERVHQLRRLAVAYSTLIHQMAMSEYFRETGNVEMAKTAIDASLAQSEAITRIVAKENTDYYLFEDEPEFTDENGRPVEFAPNTKTPRPIMVGVVPRVKALHAMALYELATSGEKIRDGDKASRWQMTLLQNAIDTAKESIAISKTEETGDIAADNTIAELASGWSALSLGMMQASDAPYERNDAAQANFKNAVLHLENARSTLKGHPASDALANRIAVVIDRLKNNKWFLDEARRETVAGRPDKAYNILRQASLRYRDGEVWTALFMAGIRAGVSPETLQKQFENVLKAGGILESSQPEAALLDAKFTSAKVWRRISESEIGEINEASRKELQGELDSKFATLNSMIPETAANPIDAIRRPHFQAMCANLLHLRDMLNLKKGRAVDPRFIEFVEDSRGPLHASVRESERQLTEMEKNADGRIELAEKLIELRESRIGQYLALGHMAARYLPKKDSKHHYYEDAMIGYQAAYDDIAALPYSRERIKALGSPLLQGIEVVRNKAPDSDEMILSEERSRRVLMERFMEGTFVLQFGSPTAAAQDMKNALQERDIAIAPSSSARAMFLYVNGLGAKKDFDMVVKAFYILFRVEAVNSMKTDSIEQVLAKKQAAQDLYLDALEVARIDRNDETTNGIIGPLVDKINAPVIGYVLAKVLDCRVASFEILDDQVVRKNFIESFKVIDKRVEQLVKNRPAFRIRYPGLLTNLKRDEKLYEDDTNLRLALSDIEGAGDDVSRSAAINMWDKRISLTLLKAYAQGAEVGLKRHPESTDLWRLYFSASIEELRRAGRTKRPDVLLRTLAKAKEQSIVSQIEGDYFRGIILEYIGQRDEAIAAHQDAAARAKDDATQAVGAEKEDLRARYIQATAKVVELEYDELEHELTP